MYQCTVYMAVVCRIFEALMPIDADWCRLMPRCQTKKSMETMTWKSLEPSSATGQTATDCNRWRNSSTPLNLSTSQHHLRSSPRTPWPRSRSIPCPRHWCCLTIVNIWNIFQDLQSLSNHTNAFTAAALLDILSLARGHDRPCDFAVSVRDHDAIDNAVWRHSSS